MDVSILTAENAQLRARIRELEHKLLFLRTHVTLGRGITGERLVARLTSGDLTRYNESYDVLTPGNLRLEVKAAKRSLSTEGYDSTRWRWNNIFGENGLKTFDFLVLAGESDPRYAIRYREPESPYVLFLIAYDDVMQLTLSGGRGNKRMIKLGTNPRRLWKKNTSGRALYDQHQVTAAEIESRFRLVD